MRKLFRLLRKFTYVYLPIILNVSFHWKNSDQISTVDSQVDLQYICVILVFCHHDMAGNYHGGYSDRFCYGIPLLPTENTVMTAHSTHHEQHATTLKILSCSDSSIVERGRRQQNAEDLSDRASLYTGSVKLDIPGCATEWYLVQQ